MPYNGNYTRWEKGHEACIYTRLIVKEDSLSLYGFAGAEERNLFNLITGVSGFGPRLALSILGLVSATQFYIAILEENVATLCQIPGIGKKSAQRLILELKEKLPQAFPSAKREDFAASTPDNFTGTPEDEAVKALFSLGYSQAEAISIIENIPAEEKDKTAEELIKIALKKLATR